jgi:hypothetical protein
MNADDTDGGADAGAESDDAPLSDEQRAELVREQLRRLRVADVANDIMVTLVTIGYQKLGLTTETRDLQNLEDAHLAIEVLRSLVETVGREVGEAQVAAFRSTLDGMQMNYARVIIQGGAAAPAAPSEEAAPAPAKPRAKSKPGAKAAPQAKTKAAKARKAAKAAKSKPASGRRTAGAAPGDDTGS